MRVGHKKIWDKQQLLGYSLKPVKDSMETSLYD